MEWLTALNQPNTPKRDEHPTEPEKDPSPSEPEEPSHNPHRTC